MQTTPENLELAILSLTMFGVDIQFEHQVPDHIHKNV